jgi:hypothetical protein
MEVLLEMCPCKVVIRKTTAATESILCWNLKKRFSDSYGREPPFREDFCAEVQGPSLLETVIRGTAGEDLACAMVICKV